MPSSASGGTPGSAAHAAGALNGLNEMDCNGLAEVAPELALGVLTGRERAQAIMHLDGCDACRGYVRELAITEEELLGLLPGCEPPAGFKTRVMSRLGFAGRHHRRPPRRPQWILARTVAWLDAANGRDLHEVAVRVMKSAGDHPDHHRDPDRRPRGALHRRPP
jgi:hypothetical protein